MSSSRGLRSGTSDGSSAISIDAAAGELGHGFIGLYAGMGGLVTSDGQALGNWWAYRRYAEITGQRVSVTPGRKIDGVAGTDLDAPGHYFTGPVASLARLRCRSMVLTAPPIY